MSASIVVDRDTSLLVGSATAEFDPSRTYRYALTRYWATASPAVFVMLNPSTADAFAVDRTVRRCLGYARAWQAGGLVVLNAFGLRSTDPAALRRHADPVGPDNDAVIRRYLACAPGPVVVAWGADPAIGRWRRDWAVAEAAAAAGRPLVCLGTTRAGAPRHPLYLPAVAERRPWTPPRSAE